MRYDNLLFGAIALGFGLVTLVMRFVKPDAFAKLGAMKQAYGERMGLVIHIVAYTIAPLAVGAFLLSKELLGP
jgi:hypothetical protein